MSIILDGLEKAQKKERMYIPRTKVPAKEKRRIHPRGIRYKCVLYILCAAVVAAGPFAGLFYKNIRYKAEHDPADFPLTAGKQSILSRYVYPGKRTKEPHGARSEQADFFPAVSVTGILWDKKDPMVLVNNKILRKGELIAGAKIVSIRQSAVCFLYKGKSFEVPVE